MSMTDSEARSFCPLGQDKCDDCPRMGDDCSGMEEEDKIECDKCLNQENAPVKEFRVHNPKTGETTSKFLCDKCVNSLVTEYFNPLRW